MKEGESNKKESEVFRVEARQPGPANSMHDIQTGENYKEMISLELKKLLKSHRELKQAVRNQCGDFEFVKKGTLEKGVFALSQDHKPDNEDEKKRIVSAHGFVVHGRINCCLNLSRAIGDFEFKSNS